MDVVVRHGLAAGGLDQLDTLSAQASQLSQLQDARHPDPELAELRRLEELLRRQVAELKVQLRLQPQTRSISDVLLGRLPGVQIDFAAEPPADLVASAVAAHEAAAAQRQLSEVGIAYRLAGKSLFPMDNGLLGVRLETFFGGRYFEQYYVVLAMDKAERLRVEKHTIPHFIPLGDIGERYLNADLKAFLDVLSDYLDGYVGRREQVAVLQREWSDFLLRLESNPAFSLVSFTTEDEAGVYRVRLMYEDGRNSLPSRAEVVGRDARGREKRLASVERTFLSSEIAAAFEAAFFAPPGAP